MHERMERMEVFLIGGIIAICLFCCLVEGIVWVWEKLENETEEVRVDAASNVRKVS